MNGNSRPTYSVRRISNTVRGLVQAYGSADLKRRLWNTEFSRGKWNGLDSTPGDCVYAFLAKYANNGTILDLGCGAGSTGNELDISTYSYYTGIDISDVAIEKARKRTLESGRAHKTCFLQGDILSYVPDRMQHNIILFRDSIYYVPPEKIKSMLVRYSNHLADVGVFIVRMWNGSSRYRPIVEMIESTFQTIEKYSSEEPKAIVVAFRPATVRLPSSIPRESFA